ncbi:DUF2254 domain-containing protein [Curtobacterium sp. SL109]|uniref:DUF2254 domain-containing protein n=1 Tax=Curtobacterium sp. SL109 TaxID=2994662 RepID=UPI0022726741|nr:DUF2254 domain-containing protein [Curtobacterium sp. SL109]MCY1693017.1 DUF2254 domain-containing protein [Curtobacterium sp. SL109]
MRTATLRIRESFWFLPAVYGICAVIAAQVLVSLDQHLIDRGATRIVFLDALSASGGRSILTTIGTSMLTVAGTSFSITISVLATTSSTYGPRLVRNFMADRANQFVLAAFTSTFLYAIVVLRSVHTAIDDGTAFVPVIAIHVAVLLGILDVAVLVFFIHHIASSVQITALQKQVQTDLETAVANVFRRQGSDDGDGVTIRPQPDRGQEGTTLTAAKDGYVQSVQWERLVTWAAEQDRCIAMVAMPGNHIIEGNILLQVNGGSHFAALAAEEVHALRALVTLGDARTPFQDVEFVLQQLVEIAVRGLASGTNDPYTAVSALDLSATALVPMWRDQVAITAYLDDDGDERVIPRWPSAEFLAETVFTGVLTYGTDHPIVLTAALHLVQRLDNAAAPSRRGLLDTITQQLRTALP